MFTRKSVWSAGGDFSDPILLWYAKGVGILKQRPITDPTSWTFLAAIHGIDNNLWINFGFLSSNSPLPPSTVQGPYWNQCQHGTWYFLPWHRGYVLSLEAIVRDAIIKAGGPADWALPYWNYSDQNNPNARDLPPAFTLQTMPDGTPNPLYVERRYGRLGTTITLPLPPDDVSLSALTIGFFTGTNPGGDPGFGGTATPFSHFSSPHGDLESLPHDMIHVDVGGAISNSLVGRGLMTNPNTAALDPIFYLHHANIDRLWEVWLQLGTSGGSPPELSWQTGPVDRHFIVPMADGQGWQYAAKDVVSTAALDYSYDDIQDPLQGVSALATRLKQLGRSPNLSFSLSGSDKSMDNKQRAELIGANSNKMTLLGVSASTQVQLDKSMMKQTNTSFAALDVDASEADMQEPDRIYLNLENIRCNLDGQVLDIYINLPGDANPAEHPELRAGSIALFGVADASLPDQPHGGMGVTKVLNITQIVDALYLAGKLENLSNLEVSLLSRSHLSEEENVTVERISVYREGR